MKAKIFTAVAVAAMVLGLIGAPAHGHSPPPEHSHFLHVPGNDMIVQVGPRVCGSPQLHRAFHNFHSNVHLGQPPTELTAQLCS